MALSLLVGWANVSWSVSVECYALIILGLIMLLRFIVIVMIILVIVLLWLWLLPGNGLILRGVVDKSLSIISCCSSISLKSLIIFHHILLLLINYLPITIPPLLIHQLILWYLCIGVYFLMLVWRIPINTIGVI